MSGTDGQPTDTILTATARLRTAGCVAAEEEAALLMGAAPDPSTLETWLRRREQGEPLAWIIGEVRFCDRDIAIEPGVYVPRPQTEALARRAEAALRGFPLDQRVAADLCTGSGAIAAHLQDAVPGALVVGVDVDALAVRCARRNDVAAVVGDLGEVLRSSHFAVVTAVVPYVPTDQLRFLPTDVATREPRLALDGGADGLRLARGAVASAARLLRDGGWLFLELGGEQLDRLTPDLVAEGFVENDPWFDDDGDLRGVAARR